MIVSDRLVLNGMPLRIAYTPGSSTPPHADVITTIPASGGEGVFLVLDASSVARRDAIARWDAGDRTDATVKAIQEK